MNRILVCGTLALDYLLQYRGEFAALPTGTSLNFSMQVDDLARQFGGCALNICYSLKLLGDEPQPFVVAGRDYHEGYDRHLAALEIDTQGVRVLPSAGFSPHAFIFTDVLGNQLTGFYSGPSDQVDEPARLGQFVAEHSPAYAVLAPDLPGKQIRFARLLRKLGVPFLSDPGQCLTDFTALEMRDLIAATRQLMVNRYEWQLLQDRLGLAEADLVNQLEWVVVTQGAEGAEWRHHDGRYEKVPAVAPRAMLDPTGCGDAFRAGFVHAHVRGTPIVTALRCGALAATINLETRGGQSHSFVEWRSRYVEAWGADLAL